MNISSRPLSLLLIALGLTWVPFSVGQTPAPAEKSPASTPPPPADTPPAPVDPAVGATASPTTPAAPADAEPRGEDDRSKYRRLDQAAPGETPNAESSEPRRRSRGRSDRTDFPFGDHTVSKDSRIHDLVSIFGSSTVDGQVLSDAVSVGGDTLISPEGRVGGGAVSVLGRLENQGTINRQAVSVLGAMTINGYVGDQAVAVLGNMHLGPKAVVDGDLVVIGGRLTKDPGAVVNGNEVRFPILGPVGNMEWLTTYLKRCVFYGRPLAFGKDLGWAWAIAFSFFAFYLLLSLIFPTAIVKCAETLETRPGYSLLSAILTVMLSPVVTVLLAITVVGALLVPFLGAGLLFAGLFGKAVMLAWIGRRFTRLFGAGAFGLPVVAVLIGGFVVLMLYTIPIMGFLTYKLLSWLGLGVVVYTIARTMKRDRRAVAKNAGSGLPPVVPVDSPSAPVEPTSAAFTAPASTVESSGTTVRPMTSAGFSGPSSVFDLPPSSPAGPAPAPAAFGEPSTAVPPIPPPVAPPPPAAEARPTPPRVPMTPRAGAGAIMVWPRASFVIRLAALALDGVLIGLILAFISGMLPRMFHFNNGPGGWLITLAIYGAIMWKLKGTTIGGIVCGLKVVRVDHRELDWPTAVVRALACFLSLAVAGLGFIWIAIDDEKQSWHDKIAGTAVVVVPKGVSLV